MPRGTESSAQRRKLLGEIERLAEVAIFGTLSETYRTCGRAGCHCQTGGPKHGPHLNVSGKKRDASKTHGQTRPLLRGNTLIPRNSLDALSYRGFATAFS